MKPLLISIAILMVAVPVADAAKFRGQTSQDLKAVVATKDDGSPARVTIFWRAPCGQGRLLDETSFFPRFDESTGTFVRDRGTYTTKITDEDGRKYRFHADGRVRARQVADDKWRGRFRVSGELRRDGELVTRCDTGRVRWSATA